MNPRNNAPETRPSLILRLRDSDDRAAWQEFVEIYQPVIKALAFKRGLQTADSDDVTQEVLTRVARHIDSWDARTANTPFRAWLATITRNQTIQFFRERARRPATGVDAQIANRADVNEQEYDLEQERQLFIWAARRIQSRFATRTWQAFWLTAVRERPVPDVARQLDMSIAQIYVSRSRVMNLLKQTVEQSQFESTLDWRIS